MFIFISHSSTDYKIAEGICDLLEKNEHRCFLAPRDIRSGYEYAEEIMNGIENSDAMILLLSKAANQSPHVLREIERAVSKKIRILVYRVEEVELTKSMEYFLMSHQWVAAKSGDDYAEILRGVEARVEPETNVSKRQRTKPKTGIWIGIAAICIVLLTVFMMIYLSGPSDSDEEKGTQKQQEASQTPQNDATSIDFAAQTKLGDSITFGSYNGEPVEWRVLQISEDGKTATVVSQYILTMKAFDVAESGKFNYYEGSDFWGKDISGESVELQRLLRGDNRWSVSNIRTWLNATAENVVYEDRKPNMAAMSECKNGYDAEAGFLSDFTEAELEAVIVTEVETNGEKTQDRVFLLSSEELKWFTEADVSVATEPTQAALEQDRSDWYDVQLSAYDIKDYNWWLRDAGEKAYEANMVPNSAVGINYMSQCVGLEGFGIRPAMRIDLTAECFAGE